MKNAGVSLNAQALRVVYDKIAGSVKGGKFVTKASWTRGVEGAHRHRDTQRVYAAMVSGGQYDAQPGRCEVAPDEVRRQLKDVKAPWMARIECMQSLSRRLTARALSASQFHDGYRAHHISLTKQARDRRSGVARVACECLAKLILRWRHGLFSAR